MKKKHQNILIDAADMLSKIPGVTITGATATASAYVSAYRDYYEACQYFGIILFITLVAFPAAKKYAPLQTYKTEAVVVSCEEVMVIRFGELERAYNITSVYDVNGTEYKISEKETLAPKEIGDTYILYVDPQKPYSYSTTQNPYEVLYGTLFGAFFIGMGLIGIYTQSRKGGQITTPEETN